MEEEKIKKIFNELRKYHFEVREDENYYPESSIKAALREV